VAAFAGEQQRRVVAEPRDRPHVRAGSQQHPHDVELTAARGPVERRHAVALGGVDVLAARNRRAHRRGVAGHCCIGNATTVACRGCIGNATTVACRGCIGNTRAVRRCVEHGAREERRRRYRRDRLSHKHVPRDSA
jgi:hypothetical protein